MIEPIMLFVTALALCYAVDVLADTKPAHMLNWCMSAVISLLYWAAQ